LFFESGHRSPGKFTEVLNPPISSELSAIEATEARRNNARRPLHWNRRRRQRTGEAILSRFDWRGHVWRRIGDALWRRARTTEMPSAEAMRASLKALGTRVAPLAFVLLIAVFLGARAMAAPPLTTVQDTLYLADGTPYTGFLIIEWKSFEASDTSTVATQSMTLRIYNGQFKTRLVPHYRVRYVSAGKQQAMEVWQVPPSSTALRVKDVRMGLPGSSTGGGVGGSTQVQIEDVVGLSEELALRPRKGVAYTAGRAAIINGLGELDGASGGDGDCMKVDGFAGSCGDDVGAVIVDPEPPAGNVDGVNAVFALPAEPKPRSSLLLYRNGLLQRENIDFTLAGQNVTFLAGSIPFPGDILLAAYRMSGTNGVGAQVLCGGQGLSTSATASTTLGSCTIPLSLLRAGDRIEIKYDYVHSGTVSAFTAEVLWAGLGDGYGDHRIRKRGDLGGFHLVERTKLGQFAGIYGGHGDLAECKWCSYSGLPRFAAIGERGHGGSTRLLGDPLPCAVGYQKARHPLRYFRYFPRAST
jgi:hypothetical protein